jgi:hypothetical protein
MTDMTLFQTLFRARQRRMTNEQLLEEWTFLVERYGRVEDSGDEPRILREEVECRNLLR